MKFGNMSANPWGQFKGDVIRVLEGALSKLGWRSSASPDATLEEPPDLKLGDIATRICFDLAKLQSKPPATLAAELVKEIRPIGLVERVEVAGNYVNFFVDIPQLAELTLQAIERHDRSYGCSDIGRGKKVLVEHTSVNPTKPLHIGHGRNAVIGDTMARLLRALGYQVEVHNYIDDMGRQVAETLLAYRLIKERPKAKFDHMLGLIYSDIHVRIEREPELEEEVRKILAQLEQGTGVIPEQARRLSEKCVRANLETTDRLGVGYDVLVWESDLVRSGILGETLHKLKCSGYLVEGTGEYTGALVLKLSDFGLEDKVLVRSDGTAVYTMRDIAYQLWKFGKTDADLRFRFHSRRPDRTKTYTTSQGGRINNRFGRADIVINVVGAEQRFPQQVVFNSLRALGLETEYWGSQHLAYEHVRLPSGKFSGRKGTWIGFTVDDVIEEAVARSRAVIEEHAPDASKSFKRRAAEFVGLGAVRYSLVSTSPDKCITFKWEEALSFERNSGPAVQYSHARACSILRKAKKFDFKPIDGTFKLPQEQRVIRLLAKFPEVIKEAGLRRQPHLPALYAAELALAFNSFYEVAPVIDAETPHLRDARLRLVNGVRVVLRNALDLMGIKAPERM
ncbi:MAG: arginine--tRNA ligase [Candidatus Hadarchaeaceae archaeon]